MSSEQALKTVVEFSKLPETEEKKAIDDRFLSSEISNYEFFCQASRYIEKIKLEPEQKYSA